MHNWLIWGRWEHHWGALADGRLVCDGGRGPADGRLLEEAHDVVRRWRASVEINGPGQVSEIRHNLGDRLYTLDARGAMTLHAHGRNLGTVYPAFVPLSGWSWCGG